MLPFLAPAPWKPPEGRPPRVLLVKLSALGDVLHALPVLAALKREIPAVGVDWVVEDRAAGALEGRREIARRIVFPRRALVGLRSRPFAAAARALAFVRELRARRYDVVLDLQGNLKSGVVARLARSASRWGFARGTSREGSHLFSNRHVKTPAWAVHRVERNLALLSAVLGRTVAWADPGLPVAPAADRRAALLLAAAGLPPRGYVLLHPGVSAFGAFKRWPPGRFADLARHLDALGESVAVTAAPGEETLARGIAKAARAERVRAIPVGDLPCLGALLSRAKRVVAADTGPLHLAALGGAPLLGLYGPKDPAVYGPYGRRADGTAGRLPVVHRTDVACRPCGRRRCGDPVCMSGLSAEQVLRTRA